MASQCIKNQQNRKDLSINSMYFNRYLLIRYLTAGFFFVNLYWFILMLESSGFVKWIPLCLLIVHSGIAIEQVSKYWYRNHQLKITKWGYLIQIVTNLVIVVSLSMGNGKTLVPFFTSKGVNYTLTSVIVGLLLAILVERRVWLIEHDLDVHYKRLQIFVSSLD